MNETYDSEIYTLPCTFIRETEKAVLINPHDESIPPQWISLSQVKEMHKDKNGAGRIVMTAWIAKEKGLI